MLKDVSALAIRQILLFINIKYTRRRSFAVLIGSITKFNSDSIHPWRLPTTWERLSILSLSLSLRGYRHIGKSGQLVNYRVIALTATLWFYTLFLINAAAVRAWRRTNERERRLMRLACRRDDVTRSPKKRGKEKGKKFAEVGREEFSSGQ